MVESVKFIKIKGPWETQGSGFDEKCLPRGRNLTKLENLRQGCGGCNAWKMRHARALLGLLLLPYEGNCMGGRHDKKVFRAALFS